MRFLPVVLFVFVMGLQIGQSSAQNVEDYASVAVPEDWIALQNIPELPDDFALSNGIAYLLADYQAKEMEQGRARYERYANQLTTSTAVEENSTISIRFDPSYQTVILHSVDIIRDGVTSNRLDLSEFQAYRFETERDRLIYNGELELAYIVPDVRVGDILDHSYTIVGRNPAFGPHFSVGLSHAYGVDVARITNRLLVEDGLEYRVKAHRGAPAPQTKQENGFTVMAWSADDVEGLDVEDDRPYWHFGYPVTHVTSFTSWAAAGQHLASAYDPAQYDTGEIAGVADKIRAAHADPSDQLRAALDYVQSNVRYLGIEFGAGGYIPRAPELVLARRFGDCKDVTLLLITILQALDIKAEPVLVNLADGHGLTGTLPSIGSFDHVVVGAWLDGKQHFLDATRDPQMGDMIHMDQGDFGYGLTVSPDSTGLFRAVGQVPTYRRDFVDTFDLTGEGDEVFFSSQSIYRGSEASRMSAWVDDRSKEAVEDIFLSYFEDYFPTIEQFGPFLVTANEAKAELTITAFYRIPEAWNEDTAENEMRFDMYAGELTSDLPAVNAEDTARKSPYLTTHEIRTRHTINVKYPDGWGLQTMDEAISLPSLEYREIRKVEGQIYRNVFTFESKSNQIAPEDFEETIAALDKIRDNAEVSFWYSLEEAASN